MVQVATQGPQEMDRITRRILDPDLTSDLERDGEAERERETYVKHRQTGGLLNKLSSHTPSKAPTNIGGAYKAEGV